MCLCDFTGVWCLDAYTHTIILLDEIIYSRMHFYTFVYIYTHICVNYVSYSLSDHWSNTNLSTTMCIDTLAKIELSTVHGKRKNAS